MAGKTVTVSAKTVIEPGADLVLSAADVAVTITGRLAATVLGAVYVAEVVVTFESVPQAAPAQPAPLTLQVTPLPDESFATLAVKFTVWP